MDSKVDWFLLNKIDMILCTPENKTASPSNLTEPEKKLHLFQI